MAPHNRVPYRSVLPEHAILRERIARACAEAPRVDDLLLDVGGIVLEILADLFAVDLVEDDGTIQRRLTLHGSAQVAAQLDRNRRQYPLHNTASYGYPRVIKTGKSQFIPGVTPRIADRLLHGAGASAEQPVTVRSFICVPMLAHGRILGALTLANVERPAFFSADDLLISEEIAEMLASCVDKLL